MSDSSLPTADLSSQKGRIATDHFAFLSETLVHQGAVVGFYQGVIVDGDGKEHARDVIRHPGAVSIVALDEAQRVIIVQQYRAAVDADLLELPAGKCDVNGEPPELTARRELEEEVGLQAAEWSLLCNVHHSPGFCDEYGYVYLATGLSEVSTSREGPEELVMSVHQIPLAEAAAMCLDGRITDAKSIAGLLSAARKFGV